MAAITDQRFVRPTLYGSAVAVGLFSALYLVIMGGASLPDPGVTSTPITMRVIKDTPVEPTPPRKPVKPEVKEQPLIKRATADMPQRDAPPVPITMPDLKDGLGPTTGPISVDSGRRESDLVAWVLVAPQYPRAALRDGIEGWVDLEVVVNPDGTVRSARATNAQPRGVFEAAAVQAMLKSKFKPKVVDGIAVEQAAIQRVDFKMEAAK